jgi:hypothetical protein
MAAAGATTMGGLRSLSSVRRREGGASSRQVGGGARVVGVGVENFENNNGLRGGTVRCSRRGGNTVTASSSSAAAAQGLTGGVTAAAGARGKRLVASWGGCGVVRTRNNASDAVVARAAAVTAELAAGDDAAVAAAAEKPEELEEKAVSHWRNAMPANDAIDKQIVKLFIPAMLNFLIIPLVGAVDLFWIGRMGSAVALAAQGAANQVFQSAFWIISFMPSVIAPVVAKAAASGDTQEVQRAVGEAVFVASFVGLLGMALLTGMQDKALGIVGVVAGSPTAIEAGPYIGWRALTFIPAIISTVGGWLSSPRDFAVKTHSIDDDTQYVPRN